MDLTVLPKQDSHHGQAAQHHGAGNPEPAGFRAINPLAAQPPVQQGRVDVGCRGTGQSQAGVRTLEFHGHQCPDKQEIQQHVGNHGRDRDLNRGLCILAGIIAGRQHLDCNKGRQACGVGGKTQRRHFHVAQGKCLVLEQRDQNWFGQHDKTQRSRQGDDQRQSQGPVQRC